MILTDWKISHKVRCSKLGLFLLCKSLVKKSSGTDESFGMQILAYLLWLIMPT